MAESRALVLPAVQLRLCSHFFAFNLHRGELRSFSLFPWLDSRRRKARVGRPQLGAKGAARAAFVSTSALAAKRAFPALFA